MSAKWLSTNGGEDAILTEAVLLIERAEFMTTRTMMKNTELEQLINDKLNSAAISDYAPNGLQVEGKS